MLRPLGPLGGVRPDEMPEALVVLGEDAQGYRVLVMCDGTDEAFKGALPDTASPSSERVNMGVGR